MAKLIEANIDSVRISLTNAQRLVILKESNGTRFLPIWIGPYAAEAITIALQEIEVARPETHDLFKNVIQKLDGHLRQVEIVSLKEDVYYGNLLIESKGKNVNVDSRPSDALALAVRFHVPIMVEAAVWENAGIHPEQDILAVLPPEEQVTTQKMDSIPDTASQAKDDDRLSIFEEFLDQLPKDDSEKNDTTTEPPEDSPKN